MFILNVSSMYLGFPGGSTGKESTCQADESLIAGSGRSPGGGHGNPLHYSCLQNPRDRGAWQGTVHRAAESQTRLKRLSTHTNIFVLIPSPLYSFTQLLLLFTNCILLCGSPHATPEFLKGREQDAFTMTQLHTVLSSAHGLFSEILTANIGATSACQ